MRLIYVDIDTLRPDHLGCYGYHRPTSPVIDSLAARGVRLTGVHASDTPCLPSRTALSTGQFGIRTGAVNHGGPATDPLPEGPRRGFRTRSATHSWVAPLRDLGMWTASISTFSERHSAYHFDAGFNECVNLGTKGLETADRVVAVARDWLVRNGAEDDWFLHVHLWDPHTPYRTPASFGDPFAGQPLPSWLHEDVRAAHWELPGPHSAQELAGFGPRDVWDRWPRQPLQAASMDDVRRIVDGYDTGVRFADNQVGLLRDARAPRPGRHHGGARLLRPRGEPRRAGHLLRPPDRRPAHHPAPRRAGLARGAGPGGRGARARERRHRAALPGRPVGDRRGAGRRRGTGALGRRLVRLRPARRCIVGRCGVGRCIAGRP